jgi:hypothetical protein
VNVSLWLRVPPSHLKFPTSFPVPLTREPWEEDSDLGVEDEDLGDDNAFGLWNRRSGSIEWEEIRMSYY